MKGTRAALLLIVLAAFLAVAGGGAAKEPAKTPFLGLVNVSQDSWKLVRLNPLTLGRRPGHSLQVGSRTSAWSYSPDRSRLVLADNAISATLVLVDTRTMRRIAIVDTGGGMNALVSATFWADAQHLYVVRTGLTRRDDGGFDRQPAALVAVDPASRAVVGSRSLDGWVYGCAHADGVLVLLLGPENRVGPARPPGAGADGPLRAAGVRLRQRRVLLDRLDQDREGLAHRPALAAQPARRDGLRLRLERELDRALEVGRPLRLGRRERPAVLDPVDPDGVETGGARAEDVPAVRGDER